MSDGPQSVRPPAAGSAVGSGAPDAGGLASGVRSEPLVLGLSPEAEDVPVLAARPRDSRAPSRPPPAPALPRWAGAGAELPTLRAQLERAELERDVERERILAAALARALVKRGAELDIALRLGRRAVLLGDDALRVELASWHCQLGQTRLAATVLAPLLEQPGLDRARLALRIALYQARLGDFEQAVAALREAAAHDPSDPLSYELLATVYGWAPGAAWAERAAESWLYGAGQRLRRKEVQLAFQDTLRAFDVAPASAPAASALGRAFEARRQPALADEVWRRHAAALLRAERFEAAAEVHRRRLAEQLRAGGLGEALATALEGRLDGALDAEAMARLAEQSLASPPQLPAAPEPGAVYDWLLCRLELWEPFVARLELAAESATGALRSRCQLSLGALLEEKLGSTERALEPWMEAVVADPASAAARANLRRYAAATGDHSPLVEALLRAGAPDHRAAPDGAAECLRELWRLSEERLGDAALAVWCVRRALRHDPGAPELLEAEQRLGPAAAAAEQELDAALDELALLSGEARVPVLRRAAAALRGFPLRAAEYSALLWELWALRPEELRFRRLLETLLGRLRDTAGLSRLWTADLGKGRDPSLAARSLLGLSRLERRAHDLHGSLSVLAADDGDGLMPAAAMQLALAAQLGQRRQRAEALLKLASGLDPALRAWLCSVASSELAALGELPAARAAAELASQADPGATRPVVASAEAAVAAGRDRGAAVALERAMALTFPCSAFSRALVEALEELGDGRAAQVWTARWLSLRPADTAAAVQLLRGSARLGDGPRLGDVVAWTLSQAHPLSGWAEPLAQALLTLVELDQARAADVSWRILDAFGPDPALRPALLAVAAQSEDAELEVALLERQLAAEGGAAPLGALSRLLDLHLARGEADRAYAVLVRALDAGLEPRRALELSGSIPEPHSAEGDFHRLEARARAYERLEDRSEECWRALRSYGAALWDLAGDQPRAVEVWRRAAVLAGADGWFHFAADLVEVLGLERALDEVCRLAESRESPVQVAALLTAAALVSRELGGRRRALQLGLLALDTDPGNVWALDIIEGAAAARDLPAVERAYRGALEATLGAYGRRALHYRAARFFERAGDLSAALGHAIEAFGAVPGEGLPFALMLRLAHAAKEPGRAAQAIEEVASQHPDPRVRSGWLRRAALIAAEAVDGAQQRMEVLLRALLAAPDPSTVELLGRALTDLARQQPDGRSLGHLRFARAVTKLVPRLDSSEGARVALGMVSVALGCFSDAQLALAAAAGAVALDPEVDEYAELLPEAARLAAEPEAARAFLDAWSQATEDGERGHLALLELAAELELAFGNPGRAAGHLARRLERGPDDAALRARAEQALERSLEPALPAPVHRLFPALAQRAELLARAQRAALEGDRAAELEALSAGLGLEPKLPGEQLLRLLELASESGQLPLAESALAQLEACEVDAEQLAGAVRAVAALSIEQRRPQRGLELLRRTCEESPDDLSLLALRLTAARAAGDDAERQEVLGRLIELTPDRAERSAFSSEAWELAKTRGLPELADELLRRWFEADPEDTQALSRLEAEHEARDDFAGLARLLARHLALGVSPRERRRLALWRAELLEARLGQLEEARQELLALLEQAPGDREVLEHLALVTERQGDRPAAAEAWLSASSLSATRPAAAELAERACRLFLESDQLPSARRVLAAPQTLPRTLGLAQLAVRLERQEGDEARLARALEELGAVEGQPARERAAAWVEAAALWQRLADEERASAAASEAARLEPDDVEAQLLAIELGYRRSTQALADDEPGWHEWAQRSVEPLRRALARGGPERADMAAFLLAEAVDRSSPDGAGLAELLAVRARLGETPLVAAGLAERLARGADPGAALEHFDVALAQGNLHGLRSAGELALGAAQAALRAGRPELARGYLRSAEVDPARADEVARLREQLPDGVPPSQPPLSAPAHLPPPRRQQEFMSAKPRELEPETRPARRTQIGLGVPAAPGARPPALERAARAAGPDARHPVAPAVQPPPDSAPRPREWGREPHHVTEPARRAPFEPRTAAERELFAALEGGSAQAGHALCAALELHADRVDDLLAASLVLSRVEAGGRGALRQLERAAEAAGDIAHVSAIGHVLDCSSPDAAPIVPPLEQQPENARVLRHLLFSEPGGQYPEALEVIWESTHRALAWESQPGLESAESIGHQRHDRLGRAWAALVRLFGVQAPLLWLDPAGDYRVNVVMLSSPTVVLRGALPASETQLLYDLGAALAGTLPAYAILNAATYEQIDDLFRAVLSAFGPPEASRTSFTSTARLAALLWESLPPRTQRRMTEWCRDGRLTRESAVAAARRAARRAGLFASGHLAEALARVAAEERVPAALLAGSDRLARLCERSKAAADLVRLATDPVYAHLRFRSELPRPGSGTRRAG